MKREHEEKKEKKAAEELAKKPTRKDKRNQKELEAWKSMVNEAGNVDFDKLVAGDINEEDMDKSLLGIAAEIEPTFVAKEKKKAEMYKIDPLTGNKLRGQKGVKGSSRRDTKHRKDKKEASAKRS